MSLLADHPNVQFNFYRQGIGVNRSGDALEHWESDHVRFGNRPLIGLVGLIFLIKPVRTIRKISPVSAISGLFISIEVCASWRWDVIPMILSL
jgi:hypothetical protein